MYMCGFSSSYLSSPLELSILRIVFLPETRSFTLLSPLSSAIFEEILPSSSVTPLKLNSVFTSSIVAFIAIFTCSASSSPSSITILALSISSTWLSARIVSSAINASIAVSATSFPSSTRASLLSSR